MEKSLATSSRDYHELAPGTANAVIESLMDDFSRPGDAVIFTDGSVKRCVKSGWAHSLSVDSNTKIEDSGVVEIILLSIEFKAVTFEHKRQLSNKICVTDWWQPTAVNH